MPTQIEIDRVKNNVANLITLNTDVHSDNKISEIADYLSADASVDRGHDLFCSLLESIFAVAALVEFPGAAAVGAFLPVFLSAVSPPGDNADLKFSVGAMRQWFDGTIEAANLQLSKIHDNPAAYWDTPFTSAVSGKQTLVSALGADGVQVPCQAETPFQQMLDKMAYQYRSDMTQALMSGLYYVYYSNYYSNWEYWTIDQYIKGGSDYVAKYPPYFFKYRHIIGPNGSPGIQYYNFSLVLEGSVTDVASDKFCAWLMQDDGFGHNTNTDGSGVARRADVFFNWGLRTHWETDDGNPPIGMDQATYNLASAAAATGGATDLVEGDGPGPKDMPPPTPQA